MLWVAFPSDKTKERRSSSQMFGDHIVMVRESFFQWGELIPDYLGPLSSNNFLPLRYLKSVRLIDQVPEEGGSPIACLRLNFQEPLPQSENDVSQDDLGPMDKADKELLERTPKSTKEENVNQQPILIFICIFKDGITRDLWNRRLVSFSKPLT